MAHLTIDLSVWPWTDSEKVTKEIMDNEEVTKQTIANLQAQFRFAERTHEIDLEIKAQELRQARLDADASEVTFLASVATVYRISGRKDLEGETLEKLRTIVARNS